VDLRHDSEEKVKVREHGREGETLKTTLPVNNPVIIYSMKKNTLVIVE